MTKKEFKEALDSYELPWRGKAEAPTSHRYRVLGNSMVVPVMRWIGEGFPV